MAVGINDDDGSAGDTKHLGEDKGGIGDVMESADFANRIEARIGEGEGVAGSLKEGNRASDAIGETLSEKSGNGFDTTDKSARQSGGDVRQTTAGGGTDVEKAMDLEVVELKHFLQRACRDFFCLYFR